MNKNNDNNLKKIANLIKLNDSVIKSIKKLSIYWTIAIITMAIGIAVVLGGLITYYIFIDDNTLLGLIILPTLAILIGTSCYFFSIINDIKRKHIIPALKSLDWTIIYNSALQIFYEENKLKIVEVKIYSMKFKNKGRAQGDFLNTIMFKYGEISGEFKISSDIEKIKVPSGKGSSTTIYKTNIEEELVLTIPSVNVNGKIALSHDRAEDNSKHLTESVAFNKKYKIEADDELEAKKFFTPKLIDDYSKLVLHPKFKKIYFTNQKIKIFSYLSMMGINDTYEIAHFKFYKNVNETFKGLANEIIEDIQKLYDNLVCAKPFITD